MIRKDGGKAFPSTLPHSLTSYPGMSLRDWFAGQALTGLLAAPVGKDTWVGVAKDAYSAADAMLEARSVSDE